MLKDWEGPISKDLDYHAEKALSASQIKFMAKSPWHYKKYVIDGLPYKSNVMNFGTLAHKIVHEGIVDGYVGMPVFKPIKDGKLSITKKSQVERFEKEHAGKTIVTAASWEKIEGMKEAFDNDPLVQQYISEDDVIEQPYKFYDPLHDIACRFMPDRFNKKKGFVVDYKTTYDASPDRFKWSVKSYGYDISAAHYMMGLHRLFPDTFTEFIFIAQESTPPYTCGVYRLSDNDIAIGFQTRNELIKRIKECELEGVWPGYTNQVQELTVPKGGIDAASEVESVGF